MKVAQCLHDDTKQFKTQNEAFFLYISTILVHYSQGVKYSIEASSSINTGVETTRSHLAD